MDLSVFIQCRMFWENRDQRPCSPYGTACRTTGFPPAALGMSLAGGEHHGKPSVRNKNQSKTCETRDQLIMGPKDHISYTTPGSSSPKEPAPWRAKQASAWLPLLQPLPSKCLASLTMLCLPMRNNPAEYMFLKGKMQETDSNDLLSN